MSEEIRAKSREKFLLWKSVQALEWAVQGGGGVTIPGGVQETFRYGTEGHSLLGNTGDMWMVGLDDLGGHFQPWWFYDSISVQMSLEKGRISC